MGALDVLCGVALLASGACTLFFIGNAQGMGIGICGAAIYGLALLKIMNEFEKKDKKIEVLREQLIKLKVEPEIAAKRYTPTP